jgi:HEAT repeat protein
MSGFRQLKQTVRAILAAPDWNARLDELAAWPPAQLTGPLFGLLLDRDEEIRWRAVEAFGLTAARLADTGMEQARVLMRSCMWRLNEESGNLGWGIPECIGASLALQEGLAREYHRILCSYIFDDPARDGNYLDHALLRRGAYWGIARLAQVRPALVEPARPFLMTALNDADPGNRGLAAWALGILGAAEALSGLRALAGDEASFPLFRDGEVRRATVGGLAEEAAGIVEKSA